jgi:polysaccharide deacetylase
MHHVDPIPADIESWTYQQRHDFLTYDITPCSFTAQMDYLVANGYTTVLPSDLAAFWDRGRPLPGRPVILTFDDGYADWVPTVLPILQARGLKAEFYLTYDRIGQQISWADVRALAVAGMGIGGHDMDHFQLAGGGVTTASAAVMAFQVEGPRNLLASRLGVTVDSMAYVGGGFDATLVGIVRQAGYSTARSILRGVVQSPRNRFLLRVSRIGLYDDIVNQDLSDLMTCNLVPGLPDFQAHLDGSDTG